MGSEFGQELQEVISFFVRTHLKIRGRVNPNHVIDVDVFCSLLGGRISCVVEELKLKLMSLPGSLKSTSVFHKQISSSMSIDKSMSKNSFRLQWVQQGVE